MNASRNQEINKRTTARYFFQCFLLYTPWRIRD